MSDQTVKGTKRLALRLLDWHMGQTDPVYAVGSSWYAGATVDRALLQGAIDELRHLWATRPEGQYDNRVLKVLIRDLEALL